MKRLIAVLLAVWLPMSANALNVFSCEPEWAALVQEVAGDNVTITQATTAFQDPHMLQARPSLIAGARSADLLICTGADLEIGWLPLLLRRSGNPGIQPGSPGYFMAADYVRRIEIPASVDRSQGDVHPQGNPHIHLHPRNIERKRWPTGWDSWIRPTRKLTGRTRTTSCGAGTRRATAGKNRRHRLPACAWFRTIAASAISPTGWTSTSLPRSNPSRASRRAAHTCRGSSSS